MSEPIRVLFVCTSNSARSQMAEAWLRHYGGSRFAVSSAGTEPAERVHPLAVATMAEVGIDISGHYPKTVQSLLDQSFDYVITVCGRARESCPLVPGDVERIHWSFDDPAAVEQEEQARRSFRRVREEVKARIQQFTQLKHKRRAADPGEASPV